MKFNVATIVLFAATAAALPAPAAEAGLEDLLSHHKGKDGKELPDLKDKFPDLKDKFKDLLEKLKEKHDKGGDYGSSPPSYPPAGGYSPGYSPAPAPSYSPAPAPAPAPAYEPETPDYDSYKQKRGDEYDLSGKDKIDLPDLGELIKKKGKDHPDIKGLIGDFINKIKELKEKHEKEGGDYGSAPPSYPAPAPSYPAPAPSYPAPAPSYKKRDDYDDYGSAPAPAPAPAPAYGGDAPSYGGLPSYGGEKGKIDIHSWIQDLIEKLKKAHESKGDYSFGSYGNGHDGGESYSPPAYSPAPAPAY